MGMMNTSGVRILGENVTADNDSTRTLLNNNDLIIGSSGAGKTTGYVIPNIVNTDESFICADTKCSLYNKLSPMLREKGYNVYVVDFVDPEKSCVYNPLDYIRYNGKTGNTVSRTSSPLQTRSYRTILPDRTHSG